MFERSLSPVIEQTSETFPCLFLTGPRQVGKTWLLEHSAEPGRKYVSLDDLEDRGLAKNDPRRFVQKYEPPVIIDEVQYAPELFTYIKIYVDTHKKNGLFWLTGSQKFRLMLGIQESLAGRAAIIDLLGLSYKEKTGRAKEQIPFLPDPDRAFIQNKKEEKPLSLFDVYQHIWEGSFPRLNADKKIDRNRFYSSYIQTYIERDVKDFYGLKDEIKFYNFLRLSAARTGTLLNYNSLANDAAIDVKTVKLWLAILERTGIVKRLEPYYVNISKRMVNTPKLYFLDTGLCSYLAGYETPEILERGMLSGAILETYVFSEILKSYWHNGREIFIYFYRDHDKREIDFVLERNGCLYPTDAKKTERPGKADFRNFKALEQLDKGAGPGALICLYPNIMPVGGEVLSIPVWEI
jgi:predicted AAA+ superfamily ATPase